MSNNKALHEKDAVEKLKELVKNGPMCHFITCLDQRPLPTRPMTTLEVDDEGCLWFLSSRESGKDREIQDDPYVQLLYANEGDSEFLSVFGTATVVMDMAKKRQLYGPLVKAYFPDGPEDANMSLVKVKPMESYYWDTRHGKVVALLKMAVSEVLGTQSGNGVEGKLSL